MPRHPHRSSSDDLGDVPLDDAPARRSRLRRGGPRTPLPLLPLIAALAGVGVAYVSQTAHATQAVYQAGALARQNQKLAGQSAQLGDQLGQLQSAERIVAAAQTLGMRPAARWTYLDTPIKPVVGLFAPQLTTTQQSRDPLQQFVATVGGAIGLHGRGETSP
ncbi:MAG: hypothetical protein M3R48_08395 [Candidatus Dormibacteraeota bacterium]|nr:hypothetical protein [Candidatus Dormibacteraeota bacterium]